MNKVNIFSVEIDNIRLYDLIRRLERGGVVFTPNVDHLMKIRKDPEFAKTYRLADYCVCDSQILLWVSHFLDKPIREKISGSDLFPAFYNYYKNHRSTKIFLLGAPKGIAAQAAKNINQKLGSRMIVGAYSPPLGFENDEKECQKIVNLINQSRATVLVVGFGAPKQEMWIINHKNHLKNVKTFLALGATIEFEAESRKRAPKWVSSRGLEWFYRLMSEPQRLWKRYLVESLPLFLLVTKEKLTSLKLPIIQYLKKLN